MSALLAQPLPGTVFQPRQRSRQHQSLSFPGSALGQCRRLSSKAHSGAQEMLTGLARQWPALSTALRWPKGTGLGLRQEYSSEAQARMLSLLQLSRPDELQDFLASMILSECAYKKLEMGPQPLVKKINEFLAPFPSDWVQLSSLQITRNDVAHHYICAVGPDVMYVAFMGTKQARDLVTDVYVTHEPMWAESLALATDNQAMPSAHRGFLRRARTIDIQHLYEEARSQGRRLVLCGHSLGGAVAKLCTLSLLRELPDTPTPHQLRCIAFATPAVGNSALARLVDTAGWSPYFSTFYLPEDNLMRMLSVFSMRSKAAAAAAAAAAREVSPDVPPQLAAAAAADAAVGAMSPSPSVDGGELGEGRGTRQQRAASEAVGLAMRASLDSTEGAAAGAASSPARSRLWARFKRATTGTPTPTPSPTIPTFTPPTTNTTASSLSQAESALSQSTSSVLDGVTSVSSLGSFDGGFDSVSSSIDITAVSGSSAGVVASLSSSVSGGGTESQGSVGRRRVWPGSQMWRLPGGQATAEPYQPTTQLSSTSVSTAGPEGEGQAAASSTDSQQPSSSGRGMLASSVGSLGRRVRDSPSLQRLLNLAPQLVRVRLPSPVIFHHFGTHMYIGHTGAHPVAAAAPTAADPPAGSLRGVSPARQVVVRAPWGAAVALPSHPFTHHRMAAYRARVLHLLDIAQHPHQRHDQGHLPVSSVDEVPAAQPVTQDVLAGAVPASTAAPAMAASTFSSTASVDGAAAVLPGADAAMASGGAAAGLAKNAAAVDTAGTAAAAATPAGPVQLHTVIPPIRPLRATARPPLAALLAPGGSPAAAAQVVVQVQGLRLQQSRTLEAAWVDPAGKQSVLPATLVRVAAGKGDGAEGQGAKGQEAGLGGGLSTLVNPLYTKALQVAQFLRLPVAGQAKPSSASSNNPRPRHNRLSHAVVSVSVPANIMQQLLAASTPQAPLLALPQQPNTATPAPTAAALPASLGPATAAPPASQPANAQAGVSDGAGMAAVAGALPPQGTVKGPGLQLNFASDFHHASIGVQVQPWRVGVVSASRNTARQVEQLMDTLFPPAEQRPPPAAARRLAMLQTVMQGRSWPSWRGPAAKDATLSPPVPTTLTTSTTTQGTTDATPAAQDTAAPQSAPNSPMASRAARLALSMPSLPRFWSGSKVTDAPGKQGGGEDLGKGAGGASAGSSVTPTAVAVSGGSSAESSVPSGVGAVWEAHGQVLAAGVAAAAAAATTAAPGSSALAMTPPPVPTPPPLPSLTAALSFTAAARALGPRATMVNGESTLPNASSDDGTGPGRTGGEQPTAQRFAVLKAPSLTTDTLTNATTTTDTATQPVVPSAPAPQPLARSWSGNLSRLRGGWSLPTPAILAKATPAADSSGKASGGVGGREGTGEATVGVQESGVGNAQSTQQQATYTGLVVDVVQDEHKHTHGFLSPAVQWVASTMQQSFNRFVPRSTDTSSAATATQQAGTATQTPAPAAPSTWRMGDRPAPGSAMGHTAQRACTWDVLLVVMSIDDVLGSPKHGVCGDTLRRAVAAGVPLLPLVLLPTGRDSDGGAVGAAADSARLRHRIVSLAAACHVPPEDVVVLDATAAADSQTDSAAAGGGRLSRRLQNLAAMSVARFARARAGGGSSVAPGMAGADQDDELGVGARVVSPQGVLGATVSVLARAYAAQLQPGSAGNRATDRATRTRPLLPAPLSKL